MPNWMCIGNEVNAGRAAWCAGVNTDVPEP